MKPFFEIATEQPLRLLKITMGGFFSHSDIAAFRVALSEQIAALKCQPNEHLTICNVAAMDIQAQEIVEVFSKVVGDPRFKSKKLAFVTGSTLARMQTQRLTNRPGVSFFKNEESARQWVLNDQER